VKITLEYLTENHPDANTRKVLSQILVSLSPTYLTTIDKILEQIDEKDFVTPKKFRRQVGKKKPNASVKDEIRLTINKIQDKINKKEIKLPAFPATARKVMTLLDDPKLDLSKIARELSHDPTITTRLINIANSAYYRGSSEVKNLQTAMVKLGIIEVRRHLNFIVTKEIFRTSIDLFDVLANKLFIHSSVSSNAAYLIAKLKGIPGPDKFIMPVLFHDIGKLFSITIIAEMIRKKEVSDGMADEYILSVLSMLHEKLGCSLLKSWKFPEEVCSFALNHHSKPNNSSVKYIIMNAANHITKKLGYTEKIKVVNNIDIPKILRISDSDYKGLKKDLRDFAALYEEIG